MHMPPRFQVESVLMGGVGNAALQRVDARALGQAQGNVFGHRQCVEQREMLENHADAQLPGQRRTADVRFDPIPENPAGVRAGHPIDDFHQGRLAGPVFTQYGMDFPGLHAQVYPVIGYNGRIPLGDLR